MHDAVVNPTQDGLIGIIYGRPAHFVDGKQVLDGKRLREAFDVAYLHHDITTTPWGTYLVLGVVYNGDIRDDVLIEFDESGVIDRVSLNTLFLGSRWAAVDLGAPFTPENWLHTNSIDVRGDYVLISARNLNTLYVVYWPTKTIVSSFGSDKLSLQHYARYQDDGTILVFNNGANDRRSGIARYNLEGKLLSYKELPFYAAAYGSVQELDNGNWLVIDGPAGVIYEFSPDLSKIYMKAVYKKKDWVTFHSKYMSILYRAVMR